MGLADYKPLRESVPFPGGELSVRGLSLDDVAVLMNHYLQDIDHLFELYGSQDDSLKVTGTAQFVFGLIREAPAMVAHLIALAADEPDQIDQARKMSMPVQVELLKSIIRLTFEEAGGAKNFFDSLKMLIGSLAPQADQTGSNT